MFLPMRLGRILLEVKRISWNIKRLGTRIDKRIFGTNRNSLEFDAADPLSAKE